MKTNQSNKRSRRKYFCYLTVLLFVVISCSENQRSGQMISGLTNAKNSSRIHSKMLDDNSLLGKVIVGYQGWLTAYGDGSPVERWTHWSHGQYQSNAGRPAPGHLTFEAYPDIKEYDPGSLFQTGFDNLGNGQSSELFSSYKEQVIDTHFRWMQEYSIDGIALQRFLGETKDPVFKQHRDDVTQKVMNNAVQYDRQWYLMYDMSADDISYFKNDVLHMENDLNILSSSNYTYQDGKPVICIWGFGFDHRSDLPSKSLQIINWLKNKGYYVIGGVPTNWRTGTGDSHTGYENVYKAFDMISPWIVGRFNDEAGANNYKSNYLLPDLSYCNTEDIDYQPVIFPGFAWSNWNGGPKNEIPRNEGKFMWRQLYNIKNAGISNMYVAMFDEYDEATNVMKMADSYFTIPTDQYFLTTSADGTYLSSDFYLRLVGKATKVLKGIDPLTQNVPIKNSNGPIWFRSSFEDDVDAQLTWDNNVDFSSNISGYNTDISPECSQRNEEAYAGTAAIMYSGRAEGGTNTFCYFKAIDVNIPISNNTHLEYWIYPQNNLSRYVAVDFETVDGSTLRDSGALDQNGVSVHPAAGHGGNIPLESWSKTSLDIGEYLSGKTIDKIWVAFDKAGSTGKFRGYIDNLKILNN